MTAVISVRDIEKHFRQHKRFSGSFGTLRTLFTRQYTTVRAVDGVSFDIAPGEAVGYLGPNGAGKSTMIKMLTGILVPSAGTVDVLGRVPYAARMQNAREIGVVFGQRSQLWWDLPVRDSFDLHRRIYRIPEARYRENLAEFVGVLNLQSFLDRAVRQLSLGQRMRCEIVMSLLHDPKVVFFDEPTIGLDVVAKAAVRDFLVRVNRERGVTVILTSHDLGDIESICHRLIMVDQGKLLFDGPLAAVRSALGGRRLLRLEFAGAPGPFVLEGAELVADEGPVRRYALSSPPTSLVDIIAKVPKGLGLRDAKIEEPEIEEVVRNYYSGTVPMPLAPGAS
jgi:ABC-2 type transport system ATP-binding protein